MQCVIDLGQFLGGFMNKNDFLRKNYLFSKIPGKYMDEICKKTVKKKYNAGEFIFFEGEEGKDFYIVYNGVVEVYKSMPDAREVVLSNPSKGELFGEVVAFNNTAYPVTARVVEDCELYIFKTSHFKEFLVYEDFRNSFIEILFDKMRHLTERVMFLTLMDVEERFLMFLENNYGKNREYNITITKKEIARRIGTIPETLSRVLKNMENDGVQIKGSRLVFPKNYCGFEMLVSR